VSRESSIGRIERHFDGGGFFSDLARRVAVRTESQEQGRGQELRRYLADEMLPGLERGGFACRILDNPEPGAGPFLIARRHEGADLLTLLTYGHGDVVRGYDELWLDGLSPWRLTEREGRWYGRGAADNKGQHTINLAALEAVLAERGRLGFNVVLLLEMGEEAGSPGLRAFCEANRDLLRADVLIASDGPRLAPERPTLFMGARGVINFDLSIDLREGGHHSGNWGGLLANPGIVLAHALSSITTASGEIRVEGWRPGEIPAAIREAIRDLPVGHGENAPAIDPAWGEPGLSPAEKVLAWPSFEVLAFTCGTPGRPANAVPPGALAHCHLRLVPPLEPEDIIPALRCHLDERGFSMVEIRLREAPMRPTRLLPDHPWVRWAAAAIERTSGVPTAILPNLGGSLPNDVFAELLGLPTLWIPHSYASCSQHAPNEHVLPWLCRDALRIMTGVFWDFGEPGTPARKGN
jgi:acetylornithine deacetylase/succinyl-diaminopimelate desuccinylase-like protein